LPLCRTPTLYLAFNSSVFIMPPICLYARS
jgi:hypothetical protein